VREAPGSTPQPRTPAGAGAHRSDRVIVMAGRAGWERTPGSGSGRGAVQPGLLQGCVREVAGRGYRGAVHAATGRRAGLAGAGPAGCIPSPWGAAAAAA